MAYHAFDLNSQETEVYLPILAPRDSLLTSSFMELAVLPPIPFSIFESAFPRLSLAFT